MNQWEGVRTIVETLEDMRGLGGMEGKMRMRACVRGNDMA